MKDAENRTGATAEAVAARAPEIDDAHRRHLLAFLLVKTAPVRGGVKPAELLRVRNCYEEVNEQGFRFCLTRRDIYFTLGLEYVELKAEEKSSLVLFFDRATLAATLGGLHGAAWLGRLGYPVADGVDACLAELKRRAQGRDFPHEVGVFVGYPVKDVVGFMKRLPASPAHRGPWRVYGNCAESLRRMRLYARAEEFARRALATCRDLGSFFDATSNLNMA